MRTQSVAIPRGVTEESIARRQAPGQIHRDEAGEDVCHVAPEAGLPVDVELPPASAAIDGPFPLDIFLAMTTTPA